MKLHTSSSHKIDGTNAHVLQSLSFLTQSQMENSKPVERLRGLVPQQPYLSLLPEYKELLILWNPYSLKNKALCYQFKTDDEHLSTHIIPDGCADFIFKCDENDPTALFKGIHLNNFEVPLEPNTTYFIFKPYSLVGSCFQSGFLQDSISEIVPLEEIFSSTDELKEKMIVAENMQERTKAMLQFAVKNMINSSYAPDVTERLELLLCNARGNVRMKNVSECLFYSSRHCRGKFKNASGISPKNFASIMRFQHTVRLCAQSKSQGSLDFNRIVNETGFYDQSHLILEFRRFAGFAPKHFFDTLGS